MATVRARRDVCIHRTSVQKHVRFMHIWRYKALKSDCVEASGGQQTKNKYPMKERSRKIRHACLPLMALFRDR